MRARIFNRVVRLSALAAALLVATVAPASAEKRIALVVGNSAYKNIAPLDNPSRDASLMAETLGRLGFTLVGGRAQLDLDKGAMDIAVQSFGRQVQGADVALFYYAGHGVQVSGSKCPIELSFYGNRCGAFAISDKSWSLVQRDNVQRAKDAALDECGKAGKACRIIGSVCADGSGR